MVSCLSESVGGPVSLMPCLNLNIEFATVLEVEPISLKPFIKYIFVRQVLEFCFEQMKWW